MRHELRILVRGNGGEGVRIYEGTKEEIDAIYEGTAQIDINIEKKKLARLVDLLQVISSDGSEVAILTQESPPTKTEIVKSTAPKKLKAPIPKFAEKCPVCGNISLKTYIVKKEGPNKGKSFKTCKTDGCTYRWDWDKGSQYIPE